MAMRNVTLKRNLIGVIFLFGFLCLTCIVFSQTLAQETENKLPAICVSGILYDPKSPSAIVNGELLKPGDSVEGATIIAISESEVTLQYGSSDVIRKTIGEGCTQKVVVTPQIIVQPFAAKTKTETKTTKVFGQLEKIIKESLSQKKPAWAGRDSKALPDALMKMMALMMVFIVPIVLILYIYTALCLQAIANKTGTSSAWRAWIPIANLFLMCDIGGVSYLWLLVLLLSFVPLLGMAVDIFFICYIWYNIAQARGKPAWLGILMLLPVINFIVMGYLAFSRVEVEAKDVKAPAFDIGGAIKEEPPKTEGTADKQKLIS
jgi:hypothetical protein